MIQWMHEATTHRFETRLKSEAGGYPNHRYQRTEGCPGGVIASVGRHDLGANCQPAGSGTGLGAPAAAALSPKCPSAFRLTKEMGRAATGVAELGRRTSLPSPLGRTSPAGRNVGGFPPLRAALAERLGRRKVAPSVVYRLLARHGWRKVAPDTQHPKSDPVVQAEWKKNFPKRWRPC